MTTSNPELSKEHALLDAIQRIQRHITPGKRFKIGKSGESEESIKAHQSDDYRYWSIVHVNEDEGVIDELEMQLIACFVDNYKDICDNEKSAEPILGGGSFIYLAFN